MTDIYASVKKEYATKKYINAYENAKKKFLSKDENNKNLVFKEYTHLIKTVDIEKPKNDITFYQMLKANGSLNIFGRNRALYLSALNNNRIITLKPEMLEYYKIMYNPDLKKYIRIPGFETYKGPKPVDKKEQEPEPEPVKPTISSINIESNNEPITMYKMLKDTDRLNLYNRQRCVCLSNINTKRIKKPNLDKLKYYNLVYDEKTNHYIRNPEYEKENRKPLVNGE